MAMVQEKDPPITVSNANKTCCGFSKAPLPEAQAWAGSFAITAVPAVASGITLTTQLIQNALSLHIAGDPSPPPLQSLLCTFLI